MWHEFPIHDSNGFAMNVIEQPFSVRDLLRAVLVDDVVVGHRQRVGEAEVDLVLARPRLALRGLDLDARAVHAVADLADEVLVVGRGEDVVVEDVRHGRRQVLVALRPRLLVGLAQEVELELRARHRREAERRCPLHLRLQHLPRRRLNRRAVVPVDVAEDERGRLEPRNPPQRAEIRLRSRSRRSRAPSSRSRSPGSGPSPCRARGGSCSLRPGCSVGHLLAEELRVEPLSHEPALHVGERDDDRVDRARLDLGLQLVERQHARDPSGRRSVDMSRRGCA